MAQQLSSAFVTLFDAEVKQAYQAQAVLRSAIRVRSGIEGSSYKFPKIGKGVAQVRIPQTDVTPLNVSYSQVTATLSDYIAAEYSDIFSQAKVNFDERSELVKVVSNAIGRRQDQLIVDALIASGTSNTIAGGSANLTVAKLRTAAQQMNAKNVPMDNRSIAIHASSLASLLSETAVTSSDFNTVKALVQGELDTFMGFKFYVMGDRDEGGLPKSGNDRKVFAFHRDAIGMAEGIAPKTEINYIPEKTSFLVTSLFSAGAVAIDAEGIVEITATEA